MRSKTHQGQIMDSFPHYEKLTLITNVNIFNGEVFFHFSKEKVIDAFWPEVCDATCHSLFHFLLEILFSFSCCWRQADFYFRP